MGEGELFVVGGKLGSFVHGISEHHWMPVETYKASYFTILSNNDQYPIIECLDEKLCLDFTNR